jgi:hypothetical protein
VTYFNLFPDREHTHLLNMIADCLEDWLDKKHTHYELSYRIPRYINLQGTRRLGNFPQLSPAMQGVADSQDQIPRKDFMEGNMSGKIFFSQSSTLVCSPSCLTIADWSRHLTVQVLHTSHAQWIFRNISLYNKQKRYLQLPKRNDILKEVN